MRTLKLPITLNTFKTLQAWAAEIRGTRFLEKSDYDTSPWFPLLKGGAAMTIAVSSVTVLNAHAVERGPKIEFEFGATLTVGGVVDSGILFSLPKQASSAAINGRTAFSCWMTDGGTEMGGMACVYTADTGLIRKYNGSNFTVGSVRVAVSGCYATL